MFFLCTFNLWIIIFTIHQVSALSYNQPKFCLNSSWNPNGTTIANITTIGSSPQHIFINTNNTIFVPNQDNGQIILLSQQNLTLSTNISTNFFNSSSIFVRTSGDIYIDTYYSIGGVSKITTSNSTNRITNMNMCQQCWHMFIDDTSNSLYCSLGDRHQIVAKSLNNEMSLLKIVGGTGSVGSTSFMLNNPRGIFVDINLDLYVADCGNNRIQLFSSGKLSATTIYGNGSLNNTTRLNCPTSIILDGNNYVYIVDSGNHRIVRTNGNGFQCLIGCSGLSGSGSDELYNPWSVSFDSIGNIYVSDRGNNRIQKFDRIANSNVTLTSGVLINFNPASLSNEWSLCYSGTYGVVLTSSLLISILSVCNKGKLMLGCRPTGNNLLTVAAMGLRCDVLYSCGTTRNCTHVTNNVGWYYSNSYSWGFVNNTDPVTRSSCDTASTNPTSRLCWHTGSIGGYRCGSVTGLNSATNYERVIYHAN